MNYPLYDPVERHLLLESLVSKILDEEVARKYWRFRSDRWYGGIATADCVGCGLTCKFCWIKPDVLYNPDRVGTFYKPQDVALKLKSIASSKGFKQARISGGEPTISRIHLIQFLKKLESLQPLNFILETNGILIGYSCDYARELSDYKFLHVRVSLKGCCPADFERLTGASSRGFELQLEALKNLKDEGVNCHAAVMRSFSSEESLQNLNQQLSKIDSDLARDLEIEEVIAYPKVAERINGLRLRPNLSHNPDNVPEYLV